MPTVNQEAGNLTNNITRQNKPAGIDVDFENVGRVIPDTVLTRMNLFGRVRHSADSFRPTTQPDRRRARKNWHAVLVNRLRMPPPSCSTRRRNPYAEAIGALGAWHAEGKLKLHKELT